MTYHRVAEINGNEWFDPNIVDATPTQFDEQMAWIAKHFNAIDTQALVSYLKGQTQLPPNPCLITFDDGYTDCLNIALPILQKHALNATFFIATDFVTKRKVYWWDRVHYLIHHSTKKKIELNTPKTTSLNIASDRENAHLSCLRIIKDTHGLDVPRFLDELQHALEVEWTNTIETKLANETVMTWDQVREMQRAGMDIQSHSVSHRVLDTLTQSDLSDELSKSKSKLEHELGQPIRAIAYPVGRSIRNHPHIVEAVRFAGYDVGFSNLSGVEKLSRSMHRYDVSRLAMDRDLSQSRFETMTAIPGL